MQEKQRVNVSHLQREVLLRLPAVMDKVGLKKSAIYDRIRRKEFPRSVAIGRRARAWRASDISASKRAAYLRRGPVRHNALAATATRGATKVPPAWRSR